MRKRDSLRIAVMRKGSRSMTPTTAPASVEDRSVHRLTGRYLVALATIAVLALIGYAVERRSA
ncbi:MAG TPA: hypothetical protein VJV97_02695 [Gemmatimonadaceae bacterium]|nr:hypothetical protein [Gemmatimonadaceae bacterium]